MSETVQYDTYITGQDQRITALEAENARLREALELCREWMDSPLPADVIEQIVKENYLRKTVNAALNSN